MNNFFISCPIGFEATLSSEIQSFWFQLIDLDGMPTVVPFPEVTIEKGGIEFRTQLHLGLQINFFTRIGLRVLLRIESFQARYFDQFERKLAELNIEKYLIVSSINLQIESSKSRLFHEGNLKESAVRALLKKNIKIDPSSGDCIFIRIFNDQVVISLDTTGEHLHFRGYRKQQGEAPLRENLASLILQVGDLRSKDQFTLLDPYCGSGTFFFEKQLLGFPNLERHYSFLNFKITPALFKSATWKKNYRWLRSPTNVTYRGFELNVDTFNKLKTNQEVFKNKFCNIQLLVENKDSEAIDWKTYSSDGQPIVVVTNPPYGERSKAGMVVENLQRMEKCPFIEKIVVIHPQSWNFKFSILKNHQMIPLSNQGIETVISIFSKPSLKP